MAEDCTDAEVVGEIINVTLKYLNDTYCSPNLQAHVVHQVIEEIKMICKKQPEDFGFKSQEKVYTSCKLKQAITDKVNEISSRICMLNNRKALVSPHSSSPLPKVIVAESRNRRRKMEDRYMVLHDINTIFGIPDDSIANYYAVFDGHGGQDAAVYCSTHLHQYLAESIYYPSDPERALRDAFLTTDAHFTEKCKTQNVNGGTTAVCTLILNKKLYVAWVGDSTAILIKRGHATNLVDPHRLTRDDEVRRIRNMGGVVLQNMGSLRVNGVLNVSRAIGDMRYKRFVTGEPETKCIPLDGTEDFLVIATDGLSDYVDAGKISSILYDEVHRRPNSLQYAQSLLQCAKLLGSDDNITVIVILLTPASEIAARPRNAHLSYPAELDDTMDEMTSKDIPLLLNMDERHGGLNPRILKHTMFSLEPQDQDNDDILASSNGKHENGDGDYDYSDLGPETDVDAIDDVTSSAPVKNLSYEFYRDNENDSSHDEEQTEKNTHVDIIDSNKLEIDNKEISMKYEAHDEHDKFIDNNIHGDNNENDDDMEARRINDNVVDVADEIQHLKDNTHVDDEQVDDVRDVVDDAGPVDYDDTPPSPQANKPLQNALILEADNVADSEDSEDEWNYYRVDPNKEKDRTTPVAEPHESKNEEVAHSPELHAEENTSEIQSQEVEQDIKCGSPKEEVSSELIDTEISAENKLIEPEDEEAFAEEKQESRDMDFQLNPDAAEFIPVSPQILGNRLNLGEDFPISGSPLKQVPQMDDIQVPSQSEFDEEICRRPHEIESTEENECQNGDHQQLNDYSDLMDKQKIASMAANLDDSEISSTKAEFGDESSASFLTATDFHRTGVSTVDESFSSSERDYDIAKDPMAMSFTPSDFEAAFEKGVDLNAVHDLSSVQMDDKNGTLEEEEENEEEEDDEDDDEDMRSQEVHPELTTLASPETEPPTHMSAFSDGEPADLVNISSQQDSESTFIEHADAPKAADFMDMQHETDQPSQIEQSEPFDAFRSEQMDTFKLEQSEQLDAFQCEQSEQLDAFKSEQSEKLDAFKSEQSEQLDAFKPEQPDELKFLEDLGTYQPKEINAFQSEQLCAFQSEPLDTFQSKPLDAFQSEQSDAFMSEQLNSIKSKEMNDFESEKVDEFHSEKVADFQSEKLDIFQSEKLDAFQSEQPESNDSEQFDTIKSKQLDDFESEQLDNFKSEQVEDFKSEFLKSEQSPLVDNYATESESEKEIVSVHNEQPLLSPSTENLEETKVIDEPSEEPTVLFSESKNETPIHTVEESKEVAPETISTTETLEEVRDNLLELETDPDASSKNPQKTEVEQTPPPSPQEACEKISENINEFMCPVESSTRIEDTSIVEPEEPAKMEVCEPETQKETIELVSSEKELEVTAQPEPKLEPEPVAELMKDTPVMNLSESMQEFTGLEKQLLPEELAPVKVTHVEPEEQVPVEDKSKDIVEPKDSVEPEINEVQAVSAEKMISEVITQVSSEITEPSVEKVVEASEKKTVETVAATAVAAAATVAAVAAVSTSAAQGKTKAKPAAKSTKAPLQSKTATKSTPTSPSKTVTSTTRTTTTTAGKKPATSTTARPKDLDTAKKPAISSSTTKTAASKPAVASRMSTTRTTTTGLKPKTSTTATSKSPVSATEKKPTTNGDVKPLSKPAAAKTLNKPATTGTSTTRTSLVKSSTTTRTATGTTTTKPRPTTAATTTKTATKPSSTTSTSTSVASSRPRTAPVTSTLTKPRPTAAKSPMIDKQIKETANKQISLARTSTAASKTTTTRTSMSATNSHAASTVKRMSSTTKTTTVSSSSPTKKPAPISKLTGKATAGSKTTSSTTTTSSTSGKMKVVQNGVWESIQITNTITTNSSSKHEEDVPKKDLSPVVAPTDNQLIMSSD